MTADKQICQNVTSKLSLYIDNKLSEQERTLIEEHLSECDECYKKFLYLKSLIKNLKDSYKQVIETSLKKEENRKFCIREQEKFMENLSPYVDNELDTQDCFEFRKFLIKSKVAQKELKKAYIMQKEMRVAYEKTKKKLPYDLSKKIVLNIEKEKHSFCDSVIFEKIFSKPVAKVAILSGLVFIGAYEIQELNTYIKPTVKQTMVKNFKAHSFENVLKGVNMKGFALIKKANR